MKSGPSLKLFPQSNTSSLLLEISGQEQFLYNYTNTESRSFLWVNYPPIKQFQNSMCVKTMEQP